MLSKCMKKLFDAAKECTGEWMPGNWEAKGKAHIDMTCKCGIDRRTWILEWLKENLEASALSTDFQEAYHIQFPKYKRRETFWGAQPVAQASRDLRRLWKEGKVVRRNVGLSGVWQPAQSGSLVILYRDWLLKMSEKKDYERVVEKFDKCRAALALQYKRLTGKEPTPPDEYEGEWHEWLIAELESLAIQHLGE